MHFYLYLNGKKQYPGKIHSCIYADELYDNLKKENSDEETKILNSGIHIYLIMHHENGETLYQCTEREKRWNIKPTRNHTPKSVD
jgi:hypothetical protein